MKYTNLSDQFDVDSLMDLSTEAVARALNANRAKLVESELTDLYLMHNEALTKGLADTLASKMQSARIDALELLLFSLI